MRFFKELRKTEFARNVLTLMTGTAIAQAIPIAISPILTRLYTPEDFGVFGLYIAIVSIVAVAAAGRYEMAIMLPKKDSDALNIIALSVIITFCVCLLLFVLIFIFNDQLSLLFLRKFKQLNIAEVRLWTYMIPISVLFVSLYQIFNYWSTRNKTFKMNAASRIGQSGAYSAFTLLYRSFASGPLGLILGNLIGYVCAFSVLAWNFLRHLKEYLPLINKKEIKENAIKYKSFPIVNAPPAILSTLQDHGILFIIAYFFPALIVGYYSFVMRIMRQPIALVGSSLYQVFFQKASNLYNNRQNIQPLVKKLYIRTFLIGLPIFLIIFIIAPQAFAFVFGDEWRFAGELAQILTPWLFLNFIASPISSLPLITNNQKKAMYFVVVDISLRIIALMIGGLSGNFKLGIYIMSTTCSMILIVALIWYYRLGKEVSEEENTENEEVGID